jgi:hypothetical protein
MLNEVQRHALDSPQNDSGTDTTYSVTKMRCKPRRTSRQTPSVQAMVFLPEQGAISTTTEGTDRKPKKSRKWTWEKIVSQSRLQGAIRAGIAYLCPCMPPAMFAQTV